MAGEQRSARAEHGDVRNEELRQKYGDLADLTVDQLQDRARAEGVEAPSGQRKEDLLQALTNR